jgi:MoaA/NifB/PqqE/SkfB family radical SAM enzyme
MSDHGKMTRCISLTTATPIKTPYFKELKIGAYIFKQKLLGRKRYPLVLMLEPLFRCNLACAGCGKIDYPEPILNRRLSVEECLKRLTNAARRW